MKKCPFCGTDDTFNDRYCHTCRRTFDGTRCGEADAASPLDLSTAEWRKPWAAAGLSAVGIGLGQFYNGETTKGVLFIALLAGIPFVLPLYTSFSPLILMLVVWAVAVADAWLSAREINRLQKKFVKKSLLFWPEVGVLVCVAGFILLMAYAPHVAAQSMSVTAGAVADTKYPLYSVPLYESAILLSPNDTGIRMSKAKVLHALGKDTEARADLDYLVAKNPNDTAPLMMTGNLLYDNGEYEASIGYFERALSINRKNAQVWVRKGDADLAIAIRDMQKMRQQYRMLTVAGSASGTNATLVDKDAFRSTQSYRDAMAAYNEAIKIDPLLSVEISAHVLAATQSLVEMYDDILDDMGSPNPATQ